MHENIDKLANGIGKAIETVPELYEDAFQPTIQETGKITARIPRAINAVFSSLDKWILNKEYSVEETKKLLAQKLENVDYKKIVNPEPYVAVPALQAISYSMNSEELRNLYANLLAKAMNSDTKDFVHPAFVEIIKQMSPNDALVYNEIVKNRKLHLVTLSASEYSEDAMNSKLPRYRFTPLQKHSYRNITTLQFITYNSALISLDNLLRLRLIEEKPVLHKDIPQSIKESPLYQDFYSKLQQYVTTPNWEFNEILYVVYPTDLGKHFFDICLREI